MQEVNVISLATSKLVVKKTLLSIFHIFFISKGYKKK